MVERCAKGNLIGEMTVSTRPPRDGGNPRLLRLTGVRAEREMADVVSSFMSIGLSEQKAKETLKNETLSSTLKTAIDLVTLRI